jgi:hypothetical protein
MRGLVVLLALVALAAPAAGSHMGMYARNPVEHDDQGRVAEPDSQVTSVLGPTVRNRVVDANLDGIAVDDHALPQPFPGRTGVLAPGCTDDTGRQPSGLCGLWTVGAGIPVGATVTVVPPGLAGVRGMGGDAAPGAFTPTKGSAVRFLDARIHLQTPYAWTATLDVNRKVDDAAAPAGLGDPHAIVAGSAAVWAWYGRWQDKNGNGVVDSLADAPALVYPPAPPRDEFVWYGNCDQGPPGGIPPLHHPWCALDSEARAGGRTRMFGFLFPGNHHSYCGGTLDPTYTCGPHPADFPGRQAVHLLAAHGTPLCSLPGLGFHCPIAGQGLDEAGERWYGDPLLDDPGSVAPDQEFSDRTGDPRLDVRQWVHGMGWPTYFYDQSALTRLIHVTAVGCPPGGANGVVLPECRFVDVDAYESLHPALDDLVAARVKPAVRAAWVLVRDNEASLRGTLDGALNHRVVRAHGVLGPLDDAAFDPGWSREPNDPGDAYPGASFHVRPCPDGDALHHGWCNEYRLHREAAHAYGDVVATRLALRTAPVGAGGGCVLCVAGTVLTTNYAGEAPHSPLPLRAAGDHRRTLGPGEYAFHGTFGLWNDRPQAWTEGTFDPLTLTTVARNHSAGPDGWVGNVINATGAWYYRGYADEACTTEHGRGTWPHAWCHPYLDGALQDPQQRAPGAPAHGEWVGRCDAVGGLVLRPADGRWRVPAFVWRDAHAGLDLLQPSPALGRIEDHTGSTEPITLRAACRSGALAGAVAVPDTLVLPAGNLGQTFTSTLTATVNGETVTDVDTYHAWGASP